MTKYSPSQIDIMLNMYFRDNPRPAPWPDVARAMRVESPDGLDDLFWKVVTGHSGKNATDPRRLYVPTAIRLSRVRAPWQPRENKVLRAALAGEGQKRSPACDVAYVATVLARSKKEVAAVWAELNADPLGRKGFFGE